MRKSVRIGKVDWSYLVSGTGDELWLTFHGYGQSAETMHRFMRHLRPEATILSFDLPGHGNTVVDGDLLRPDDLSELVGRTLREFDAERCSLAGFSLGGKAVLKLVELIPGRIDRILLIAPDGLRVNPIYAFATDTIVGRACFRWVVRSPQVLFTVMQALSLSGILNKRVHVFVKKQLGSAKKRQRVYDIWQMFKRIDPILKEVRSKIWRYHIRPVLIFGKDDHVIRPKLAKLLSGDNGSTAQVIMLNTGHGLITEQNADVVRDQIDWTR